MTRTDDATTPPRGHNLELDWMTWRSEAHAPTAVLPTTPVVGVESPDSATTAAMMVAADPTAERAGTRSDTATTWPIAAPTGEQRMFVPPPVTVRATPTRPPQPFGEATSSRAPSSGVLVGIGALSTIVVLAVGAAVWGFSSGAFKEWGASNAENISGDNSSSIVTGCATTPSMTPADATITSTGLAVTVMMTSSCPRGDILSNSQTQMVVSSPSGVVASGEFDLSAAPIAIPAGSAGRQLTLTYPTGSFYGLPGLVAGAGVSALSVSAREVGGSATQELPAESGAVSAVSSGTYLPPGAEIGQTIAQSLQAQAESDRSDILSSSNNQWVAQLSSKQPGLVADGKTWTNRDIFDEFASFYQRFSGTRLLWSDEWPVFSASGWWVTITSQTFPSPEAAVSWCAQKGFDRDHCLGKLISTTAGPAGTTAYLP